VLSDCKAAIDIVINRHHTDGHLQVMARIRSHLRSLKDVVLVWIPGHCDIYYNDVVDHCVYIESWWYSIDVCNFWRL